MENINKLVGQKIRTYRKAKGLSLKQLSALINKSVATISKYELGEISIDLQTLHEIQQALDVPLQQLLEPMLFQTGSQSGSHLSFFRNPTLYMYYFDGVHNALNRIILVLSNDNKHITAYFHASDINHIVYNQFICYGDIRDSDICTQYVLFNPTVTFDFMICTFYHDTIPKDRMLGTTYGMTSQLRTKTLKCLITPSTSIPEDELISSLTLSKEEMRAIRKSNSFVVNTDYD